MALTKTTLGTNSVRIDYTNQNTMSEIMNAMHDEITVKGWTDVDGEWWVSGSYPMVRTYSHVNEDGVSKKYLQLRYQYQASPAKYLISTQVFFDYVAATKTGTAFKRSEIGNGPSALVVNLPTYGGYIIMSTNPRWCLIHSSSANGQIGTDAGYPSFIGVSEIKCAVPDDNYITYPNFAYLNGNHLLGPDAGNGVFSLGKSLSYTNHENNFLYTQCVCPLGCWGHQKSIANQQLWVTISSYPNKVNSKNYLFDIGALIDTHNISEIYFKGNFYGVKIMNASLGVLGDIVRAKCTADYMMDANGTEKDFLIFPAGSYRWGVPA